MCIYIACSLHITVIGFKIAIFCPSFPYHWIFYYLDYHEVHFHIQYATHINTCLTPGMHSLKLLKVILRCLVKFSFCAKHIAVRKKRSNCTYFTPSRINRYFLCPCLTLKPCEMTVHWYFPMCRCK